MEKFIKYVTGIRSTGLELGLFTLFFIFIF